MLVLFSMPILAGMAIANVASDDVSQSANLSAETIQGLRGHLNDYIKKDAQLRNWKLLETTITVSSQESSGAEVTAIFDIERKFRLNFAKAEEAPAVKGRLAFMKEKSGRLSAKQLRAANKEVEIWQHDIADYIANNQDCFERIKVVGILDSNGKLTPGTIKFYSEGPLGGDYVAISHDKIPTPQAVEKAAYDTISATVKEAEKDKKVSSTATYYRLMARDYANTYTSNTSLACQSGNSTKQDKNYYNLAAYATWYQCNDCANYVSQACNYAGIPRTGGSWTPYLSCWINCDYLTTYMVLNDNWLFATNNNINECVAGYPFELYTPLSGGSRDYYHVMMMVSNDGTTRFYSAHTSDRKQKVWNGATYVQYFKIPSNVY